MSGAVRSIQSGLREYSLGSGRQRGRRARLERLAVGRTHWAKQHHAAVVARVLGELLDSDETARRCAEIAARFHQTNTLGAACAEIEAIAVADASAHVV
jgi:hypothetical protein